MGLRDFGLESVGQVPFGTHVCSLYRDAGELLDILVPYLRAGLQSNEFCLWLTAAPVLEARATEALGAAVPDLDARIRRGQIDLSAHDEWYLEEGRAVDIAQVMARLQSRLEDALSLGYEGMRIAGSTAWLDRAHWRDFAEHARALNGIVVDQPIVALYTFDLNLCGANELIEILASHQYALVKRSAGWEVMQSSERRRLSEALEESDQRLRLLFEHMTAGWAFHEVVLEQGQPVDYVYLDVNSAFERQSGIQREQILGHRASEVLAAGGPPGFDWIGVCGRVALTGASAKFEAPWGASGRWYSVSAYCPAPGFFATLLEDITERRTLEQHRSELVRLATHDLRTPLSAIAMAVQGARRRPECQVAARGLDTILRSCERMDAMLVDLATAGRLELASIPPEQQPVDIAAAATQLLSRLSEKPDTRRVRLVVPDELPPIQVDPTHLERILENLTTSVLKSATAEEQVVLEIESVDNWVEIVVACRAQGVQKDDVPHSSGRFERSAGALRSEGLGLSLLVVRSLVAANRGTFAVDSASSGGAGFRVRFARSMPATDLTVPAAGLAQAATHPCPSIRVLVVEDDQDARETLGEYLTMLGCECEAFASAAEALRYAAVEPPGLALIDLGLDDTDGYDVARRLRAVPGCGATQLVALTGFSDSATRARAASAGFDDFLVKPLATSKLEALLRSLPPRE